VSVNNNIDRTEPAAKFLLKMVGLDARPFLKVMLMSHRQCFVLAGVKISFL